MHPSAKGLEAGYVGRFAPSPTGPLHAGSLVAAIASWLDARAHGGQWLVRMEDLDTPRCIPGADRLILQQLASCGLYPDQPSVYQSQRGALYQHALDQLVGQALAYPCACTRQDIALALAASGQARKRHGELVYPGTCRNAMLACTARSWRFLTHFPVPKIPASQASNALPAPEPLASAELRWLDRRLGWQCQNVAHEVGDFILKRADGIWAYQLAVVVDDAAQGITHVVRGEDLADNSPRQMLLQRALGLAHPDYLHTPLVLGANGEKLSKQNGAEALDTAKPLALLEAAGRTLGLGVQAGSVAQWLLSAVLQWPLGIGRPQR